MRTRLLLASLAMLFVTNVAMHAQQVSFRNDIAPILLSKCYGCHNAKTAEGSYRVDSFALLGKAGDSGEFPLVGGDLESELLRRIVSDDEGERMPAESDPLPQETIRLIQRWIEQGAKYDAESLDAPLPSILPITKHPDPPSKYRRPIPVTALAFVGDDLLTSGYHEVLRWNLAEQKLIQRIPQVGERIYDIEVLDEGKFAVASGSPGSLGEVRVLDLETGSLIAAPLMTSDAVLDLARQPNGNLLAAASADGKLYVIDLDGYQVTRSMDSHSDWVRAVAWNPDGTSLASASRDKTIKIFDASFDQPVATYAGHKQDVQSVAFANKDHLLSFDVSGTPHKWKQGETKKLDDEFPVVKSPFVVLSFESGVWIGSGGALLHVDWTGNKVRAIEFPPSFIFSAALNAERTTIAAGDAQGRVRVWQLEGRAITADFLATP